MILNLQMKVKKIILLLLTKMDNKLFLQIKEEEKFHK